ncbi:MAG: hypothetical protein ACLUOI_25280 [Eisenbergiella sp.]
MKLLITGGTVFVSKFTASYFAGRGHEVYVLNRGTRPQAEGVNLIKADRNSLGSALNGMYFDAVIDVCAYKEADINNLLNAGIKFDDYVLISSSAVYPETLPQPFNERQPIGKNSIWGGLQLRQGRCRSLPHFKIPQCICDKAAIFIWPYAEFVS